MKRLYRLSALVVVLVTGCGGGGSGGGGAPSTTVSGSSRPGGAVDLLTLAPAHANVVLHSDLAMVRRDPARYDLISNQLAAELGLAAESATLRNLLDRTDSAVGVFCEGSSDTQEGMLLFAGRYSEADFDSALAVATARHGGSPAVQPGVDGRRVYVLGDATLVELDQWTWAVAVGPSMRAHLTQMTLGGGSRFGQGLVEFGPRIGLPNGSAQAWANQDTQVGADMVGLVFAGEGPQMVHDFVSTVTRHLGI